MKRPMCTIGLSMAVASWAAFFFDAAQSLLLSAAAAVTALLALAMLRQDPARRWLRAVVLALLTAAAAFGLHTRYELVSIQPFVWAEGETVVAQGIVEEARIGARTFTYGMTATFPERDDLPDTPITLRAYGEMDYVAGDVIRCEVVLAPKEQGGTGLRHTKASLLEGYIQGQPERLEGGYPLRRGLITLRQRLRNNVYSYLHSTSADIVSAMVLGMSDNVSPEIYTAVNRSGTIHLLSISGLHLSILTAFVLSGLAKLGLSKRARTLLTIGACFLFATLVGFSASIIRASIMTAISLLAGINRRRRGDSLSALGLAVTVICLVWPDWLQGRGFWLSAGGTLGILLFAERIEHGLRKRFMGEHPLYNRFVGYLIYAFAPTIAAYTATMPFLIVFNGWISVIAPLSNILVTPFLPFTIVGGIFCAVVGVHWLPVRIVAAVTDLCTAAILSVSQAMSGLPFATISLDQGWMLVWMALAVGVAVALLVLRAGGKLAAYAATLLVLAFSVGSLTAGLADRGTVELVTIENCETAVLLQGKEAVILGTPAYYEINRLLRYLEFRGVSHVRAVVAADCGEQIGSGLLRLCQRYPVDCILGPDDAYILGQIATALPEVPVYSGGYATMTVFGVAQVTVTVPEGDIVVQTRSNTILKTVAEYDIMDASDFYTIGIYSDGAMALQGATGKESARVGSMLYGETRFRLRVE